ncbi:MAG: response regulator transcription factor [Acutalibacteraceae bacterium]
MAKTRVLIVDDQLVVRQLFEMYLKSSEKYELVGSLSSAALAENFICSTPVDLIIMDILMNDGSNGLGAAEKIKKTHPKIKIVAITSMVESSWLKRAEEIGIESFYYKESPKTTILEILDRTMAGESVYPDTPPEVEMGLSKNVDFSERELDVLRLTVTGMSNAKIAKKLNLAEGTVKNIIHGMLEKTGYDNRTELAIEARVRGVAVNIDHK